MDGSVQPGINLLAFDTSTERAIIALRTSDGTLHIGATEVGRRHGRDLIPQLQKVLKQAGLAVADLQLVGVGVGPGSYTGLRVGLMAAKTLAYTSGAALVGLDSLETIARNAPESATRVAVVADAQRGDVYSAAFARRAPGDALERTRATVIEPVTTWAERLTPGEVLMGPGLTAPKISAVIPAGAIVWEGESAFAIPGRLVELASEAWLEGRRDDFWTLEPLYLRRSSAEEQWDRRSQPHDQDAANLAVSPVPSDLAIESPTTLPGTP